MTLPVEPENLLASDETEEVDMTEDAKQLEWRWAAFGLEVPGLVMPPAAAPAIMVPEQLAPDVYEFVYPIRKSTAASGGLLLETSKASDMFHAGMSMCRLYMTIEKIFSMAVGYMDAESIAPEEEVQVMLHGDERAKRKGFEVLINCSRNLISDYDPGPWAPFYLDLVKTHAAMGKGYPKEAPRDRHRQVYGATPSGARTPSR